MSDMTPAWRTVHAVGAAALGLVAGTALAHVLEMPHKLVMSGETWLPIQQTIYNGWGQKLFYLDLLAVAGLAVTALRFAASRALAALSIALLLVADVAVFLIWINPTNTAVDAWGSAVPMPGWTDLRMNWEWGHAARAVILTISLLFAILSAPRDDK